ncbi:MAG: sulfatase [Thermoanaerobaculia bacterium]
MRRLAALTVVAVSFHVLMEWLFFVTKPSFLTPLRTEEKALIPWMASAPLLAAALALLLALAAVARTGPRADKVCVLLARGVPALVLASTLLLLIDNFTRTLFGWGSASLEGSGRALPLLPFALLAAFSWRWLGSWINGIAKSRIFQAAALVIVLLSTGAALGNTTGARAPDRLLESAAAAADRPNILLLGSDALDADRTSLFGYERDTTPFLACFAREALVFENAFPNGASTASSTVSLLSGRLPTETGVIYPPDIAKGDAAHLHLPGLLRRLGYRTGQFTIRWYADASDFNLQGAFDWANSRSTSPMKGIPGDLALDRPGQMSAYFLALMSGRLAERLLPSFLGSAAPQQDPFLMVQDNAITAHGDDRRLRELFRFIDASGEPFFAHIHLMGTHGRRYKPRQRIYSAGQAQESDGMTDFYDDAVADFDRSLEEVVAFLRGRGLLDRTIVVLYSDHTSQYTALGRVPLLFRFPGGARAGRVPENVQNLDVAPTLLDALGIEAPPWMGGVSLLRGRPDPCRWIVSAKYNQELVTTDGKFWRIVPRPPWYTLGSLAVISGRTAFTLDLPTEKLETSRIQASGDACAAPEPAQVRAFLMEHLQANGYQVP